MIINKDKLDDWEWELVEKYDIPYPCCDLDAYNQYPGMNWVYDKYKLSKRFNPEIKCNTTTERYEDVSEDDSIDLPRYIIKPRINLWGLGHGIGKSGFGFFVQELVKGRHLSVDVRNGQVYGYRGRKIKGSFDFYLWHRVDEMRLADKFGPILNLASKVPNSNFECIGDTLIEMHLRPSIQFWSLPKYSLVLHNRDIHTSGKKINWKPKSVHDWFILKPDEYDSRVAILNGDNLRDLYNFAMFIFTFDEERP